MDDSFQYFDKADLLHLNGENHLILIDQERDTNTPIRWPSVSINGNDHSKWSVAVIPDGGCSFRYRKQFDTEDSAKRFAENILQLLQ